MDKEQLKQELTAAADGLLMLSESEAPLEFYYHDKPEHEPFSADVMAKWAGKPAGKDVEVQELDYFFRNMMRDDPEEGPEQLAQTARFRQLVSLLKRELQNVKAYKIKEIGTEVFIVGQTPSGDYAGYKTIVIET